MPQAGICNEAGEGRVGREVGFVYSVIDLLSERLRLYRGGRGSTPSEVLLKTNLVHWKFALPPPRRLQRVYGHALQFQAFFHFFYQYLRSFVSGLGVECLS